MYNNKLAMTFTGKKRIIVKKKATKKKQPVSAFCFPVSAYIFPSVIRWSLISLQAKAWINQECYKKFHFGEAKS